MPILCRASNVGVPEEPVIDLCCSSPQQRSETVMFTLVRPRLKWRQHAELVEREVVLAEVAGIASRNKIVQRSRPAP